MSNILKFPNLNSPQNQIPNDGQLRSCKTCAYRSGTGGMLFWDCGKAGFSVGTVRREAARYAEYGKINNICDINFSGWAPKPKKFQWLRNLFRFK
jgi:hypothetical protein